MNEELFEKRILFESLSCIMNNQKKIMKYFGVTTDDVGYRCNDYHTGYLVEQCDAITDKIAMLEGRYLNKLECNEH